jgi:cysteinyl-tRNA synthetase
MARDINKLRAADQQAAAARLGAGMRQLSSPLGLLQQPSEAFLHQGSEGLELSVEAIEALVDERAQARRRRDFARADEIRDRLASHGIHLEDTAEGTSWRLQ